MNLSDLRQNYTKGSFSEGDLISSPFDQFRKWFCEAQEAQIEEPNAMCLATYRANKCPNTRVVLLKDFSEKGLVFYTNYESRKAVDLETNPQAAANFLWLPLQRQVNVTGRVERIPKTESLEYFHSRPVCSQIGAWVSPQSQTIAARSVLDSRLEEYKQKFANGEVPLPDNWGGYRIMPDTFEFWQGRPSRLHDRFMYRLNDADSWIVERLAP